MKQNTLETVTTDKIDTTPSCNTLSYHMVHYLTMVSSYVQTTEQILRLSGYILFGVTLIQRNADNRVITGDGTNLNAESALVWTGTTLSVGNAGVTEYNPSAAASTMTLGT